MPPGPSVTLTWTNNDTTPPATQVEIQRATKADFSDEITLSYTGPAPASYTDSTVAVGMTYYYRVRADDPLSESHWSNSFETDPPAPTGLTDTIAAGPPLSVTLTWTSPATTRRRPAGDVAADRAGDQRRVHEAGERLHRHRPDGHQLHRPERGEKQVVLLPGAGAGPGQRLPVVERRSCPDGVVGAPANLIAPAYALRS